MERSGPLVHLDHLVLQVTEESRDLQVLMDSRVYLETKDLLENLANQAMSVFLENSVLWDKLDQGESVEFQGREVKWVPPVCRALKEYLVHPVQMDQREARGLLVQLVMGAPQVFRECLEREESLGLQDLKATEAQSVRKDQRVHQEMMVQEEPQVLLAHWDLLGLVERRVNPDQEGRLDPLAPEEDLDHEATQDQSALLDSLGLLALMANLESRERSESQVRKEMLAHLDPKAWLVHMDLLGQLVLLV